MVYVLLLLYGTLFLVLITKKSFKLIFFLNLEYLETGSQLFKESLQAIINNSAIAIKEPGKSAVQLANSIIGFEDEQLRQYAKYLCHKIVYLFETYGQSVAKREMLLLEFYNYCISDDMINHWKNFVSVVTPDDSSAQHVYQFLLNNFLQKSFEFCLPPKNDFLKVADLALSKEEEATLRYVAGYIVFSLKNRLKKKTSLEAKAAIAILEKLGSKNDNALNDESSINDYTCHWVQQVNRGGLFIVNQQFYLFVKLMEHIARIILNKNLLIQYCGQDIRAVLIQRFQGNSILLDSWNAMTKDLHNKGLSTKLLNAIYLKWANTRAHSFVRNWLEIRKNLLFKKGENVSEKAEPSMRKTLKASRKLNVNQDRSKNIAAKKRLEKAKKCIRNKKT